MVMSFVSVVADPKICRQVHVSEASRDKVRLEPPLVRSLKAPTWRAPAPQVRRHNGRALNMSSTCRTCKCVAQRANRSPPRSIAKHVVPHGTPVG